MINTSFLVMCVFWLNASTLVLCNLKNDDKYDDTNIEVPGKFKQNNSHSIEIHWR